MIAWRASEIYCLVGLWAGGGDMSGDADVVPFCDVLGWLAEAVRAMALCFSLPLAIRAANSGTVVLVVTHDARMISACFLLIFDAFPVLKLYSAQSQATVSRTVGCVTSATPDLFKLAMTSL